MTPEQENQFFSLALDYRGAISQHAELFYRKLVEWVDKTLQQANAAPQATPSREVMESSLPDSSRGPAVAAPFTQPEDTFRKDAERYRKLKSFASPKYLVKYTAGESVSLMREGEAIVDCGSWEIMDEHLDRSEPQLPAEGQK